jgi:hypothetical protein
MSAPVSLEKGKKASEEKEKKAIIFKWPAPAVDEDHSPLPYIQNNPLFTTLAIMFKCMQSALYISDFSLQQLEMAILQPDYSILMDELISRLVLGGAERKFIGAGMGYPYMEWSEKLSRMIDSFIEDYSSNKKRMSLLVEARTNGNIYVCYVCILIIIYANDTYP